MDPDTPLASLCAGRFTRLAPHVVNLLVRDWVSYSATEAAMLLPEDVRALAAAFFMWLDRQGGLEPDTDLFGVPPTPPLPPGSGAGAPDGPDAPLVAFCTGRFKSLAPHVRGLTLHDWPYYDDADLEAAARLPPDAPRALAAALHRALCCAGRLDPPA